MHVGDARVFVRRRLVVVRVRLVGSKKAAANQAAGPQEQRRHRARAIGATPPVVREAIVASIVVLPP
jgi:hypothetical protein